MIDLNLEYIYRKVAPFACQATQSLGRLHQEMPSSSRTDFARDRDRIIHSTAFRRLKHKTQVFVESEGDHYRTRLTHTLEVAQIARSIARPLGLDEDLAECIALSHDLGHPPFGHAGESVLDRIMEPYGGFDHNAQSLRIVTKLEKRYPEFDGLNLTWETREGIVKHNGPIAVANCPAPIWLHNQVQDLRLDSYASAEAQVAAISDDIAYNAHDVNDGLRSGLLKLDDLMDVTLTRHLLEGIASQYPSLDPNRTKHELSRRLITFFIMDALENSFEQIRTTGVQSANDIRAQPQAVISLNDDTKIYEKELKAFLYDKLYRHQHVMESMNAAETTIQRLFEMMLKRPSLLPQEWQKDESQLSDAQLMRKICDYIAGMTDRYAIKMLND